MVWFLRHLMVLFLALGAASAWGAEPVGFQNRVMNTCFAGLALQGSAENAIREVKRWDCAPHRATLTHERVAVRLPVRTEDGVSAAFLQSGLGRFDRLVLVAAGQDGAVRSVSYLPQDVNPLIGQAEFTARLPQVNNPVAYYAVFDRSANRQGLRSTMVVASGGNSADTQTAELLLAVLIGMLLVPALFDLAVYKALRKAFFLWHAALAVCMALLVAVWSGLVLDFADLSMPALHDLLMVALGLMAAAACMFTRSFVAASSPDSVLPRTLRMAAGYSLTLTVLFIIGWLGAPFMGSVLFSFALSPVFVLLVANLIREFRVGDRASRIQVLGWVPLLSFFAAQLFADFTTIELPQDGLPLLYFGVLVETLLSAFGVSLRFLDIRQERDMAQARAAVMGNLAERDHLTGLLNRRAIDNRFEDLRARGYDTLALIDLDHFKAINDVSGHTVGDNVLEITARVLASDPDNIAVRLGGEEFLLLLRGGDAPSRAEKLRRMVSVRVAREVDGLEQIVTASMGLLSLPPDSPVSLSFSSAYSRADLLLYEAKREGRNRTKAAQWAFYDHASQQQGTAASEDIRDQSAAVA